MLAKTKVFCLKQFEINNTFLTETVASSPYLAKCSILSVLPLRMLVRESLHL